MSSVIKELLLLSDIGKKGIKLSIINTTQIVSAVIERLENLIKEKNAKIIIPENFVSCTSYGPWIEEIWLNYISNAIKYGGTDPCIVTLGSDKIDNYVKFWVQDNGIGLSEIQQSEIFKLKDMHVIQNNIIKGNGIGLSIILRIIKRLNGYTEVQSSINHGSTFSFFLPTST